jgi:hypothetical protein
MNWKRTLLFSCLAQCCGVLCLVAIKSFGLPFLLKEMDFTNSSALLILSLLSLTNIFQAFISIITSGSKIKSLLIGNFVAAHVILAITTAGYLFYDFSIYITLVGIFSYFYLTSFGDTFWWPFIHPQIPKDKVSTFFTRLRVTWATFSFIGVLALKSFTEQLDGVRGLVLFIFYIGFVGALRVIFLIPMDIPAETSRDKKITFRTFKIVLSKLLKKKELHFIFVFVFFEPLFGPSLILYLNEIGISKGDNFLIQGTGLMSTVISLIYFNNKLKKVEENQIIKWMKFPVIFFIAMVCLSSLVRNTSFIILSMIIIKFLVGLTFAGAHLIYINRLFRTIDANYRSISMSVMNLLVFGIFFTSEFMFSIFLKFSETLSESRDPFVLVFVLYFALSVIAFYKYSDLFSHEGRKE